MVAHLRAPLQEDHRAVAHHRIDQVQIDLALVVRLHLHQDLHLLARNLVKSVQLAEVVLTALEQRVKFLKVEKSAIHAVFVPLHKNAINRAFVHVSSSLISLRMLLVKNSRRVFAQSFLVSLQRMQKLLHAIWFA
jgi:hypothetical protein